MSINISNKLKTLIVAIMVAIVGTFSITLPTSAVVIPYDCPEGSLNKTYEIDVSECNIPCDGCYEKDNPLILEETITTIINFVILISGTAFIALILVGLIMYIIYHNKTDKDKITKTTKAKKMMFIGAVSLPICFLFYSGVNFYIIEGNNALIGRLMFANYALIPYAVVLMIFGGIGCAVSKIMKAESKSAEKIVGVGGVIFVVSVVFLIACFLLIPK